MLRVYRGFADSNIGRCLCFGLTLHGAIGVVLKHSFHKWKNAKKGSNIITYLSFPPCPKKSKTTRRVPQRRTKVSPIRAHNKSLAVHLCVADWPFPPQARELPVGNPGALYHLRLAQAPPGGESSKIAVHEPPVKSVQKPSVGLLS